MIVSYKDKLFSNENLQVGDLVYPIYTPALKSFFLDCMSGYPDEPHTIKQLKRSEYKPYETSTSHGYGPEEIYFKIIPNGSAKPDIIIPSELLEYSLEEL
jgi:hypothetical protein